MQLGQFDVFRDRQITNAFLDTNQGTEIRVLKGKNIASEQIVDIEGYDTHITESSVSQLAVSKYLNKENVLCCPNLTNHLRFCYLPKQAIVNGAVALLTLKQGNISQKQLDYLNSPVFLDYFKVIKNKSKLTVNIDKNIAYYIGLLKQ